MFFSLTLLFTFPHVGICVPHTFKSLSGLSIALGIEWLCYSCAVGISVAVGHPDDVICYIHHFPTDTFVCAPENSIYEPMEKPLI